MRDHAVAGVLWVALTAAGLWVAQRWIDGLPVVASAEGRVIDHSFALLLRLVVPVFTFVVSLLLYTAVRNRSRGHPVEDVAPAPRDNAAFSWSWFAATAALNVLFVINPGLTGLGQMRAKLAQRPEELVVQVQARQWSWSFTYPQYGITVRDRLVLPAGRRVRFEITSEDVVHSFWVPAFRLKMDAVPGRVTTLYVTPDQVISTRDDPTVRVQCAELCGAGHLAMRAAVQVVDADAFQRWLTSGR